MINRVEFARSCFKSLHNAVGNLSKVATHHLVKVQWNKNPNEKCGMTFIQLTSHLKVFLR